jgi:CRISPR-associated protein Csd1
VTWLTHLTETYDRHAAVVGMFEKKSNDREYALIPVSHTTQSAHIEVNLNVHGEYRSARVVEKAESSTIIPCTEASASRTSKPVPYPLFDKLIYVAGDYAAFVDVDKDTPNEEYMRQLLNWCESPFGHPKVRSVYDYLHKGTLIADLVRDNVLWLNDGGKLLDKCPPELERELGKKPDIFKVIASEQSSAFVRFAVEIPGEPESRLWRDRSVQDAFIAYCHRQLADQELCYVTGKQLPYADKHASRIRHSGDKTKLISANDTSGFTFRGRFRTSREAAVVSYEVSQKAHNALKWLIDRQGFMLDGKVFLVWGTGQLDMPDPLGDSLSLVLEEAPEPAAIGDSTHKEYAKQIRLALNGYRYRGEYKANVVVMVLDAATPGRLSIVYYRDMNKELYLDRIQAWHEDCSWLHRYRKDAEKNVLSFVGAPSTRDIAFAAYGNKAGDKVVKGLMERMLPCIVDGQRLPLDIVRSAVFRASNPVAMDNWEWEKTLSIACALVKKHHEREGFELSLNTETTDRNYLFGRMLAIADVLERRALGREEKRATNAIRYMNAFAQRPARTWAVIQSCLQPYQARLGTDAGYYSRLLDEVGARLQLEDFTDQALTGVYLLGFYSQRQALYTKKTAGGTAEVDEASAEAGSQDESQPEGER